MLTKTNSVNYFYQCPCKAQSKPLGKDQYMRLITQMWVCKKCVSNPIGRDANKVIEFADGYLVPKEEF